MKYYIGSPKFLYYCLQKHWYSVFETYYGIIPEEEFIKEVESGKSFQFTYRIYTTSFNPAEPSI